MEELHGAAAAEAVPAESVHRHPHRGEGMGRQGQEDMALDPGLEVRQPVQTLVLPLPVDGQAVDRQAEVVQRAGQGPDVGRPCGELAGPLADVPWGQGRPEAGGYLGEYRWIHGPQPRQAEPDALEKRVRARAWVGGIGEHRRLTRQPVVRLRAEDREGDEVGEHDRIPNLALHDIVEAEGGRFEHGRAAHRLLAGPLPNRQRGGRVAGDHPARPPAAPGGEGRERVGRRQLVAEDLPGSALRAPERAAQTRADVPHRVVPRGRGDVSQLGQGGDGA